MSTLPSRLVFLLHVGSSFYCTCVQAGAIVSIQVQLLNSSSIATTTAARAFLSLSMILELLAVLLAMCMLQYTEDIYTFRPLLVRLASGAPVLFVLMGVSGLAAVLVLETVKTSVGAALAMGCLLVFGIFICVLAARFGARV